RDLVPVCKLGGMANARLSLRETVQLMDDAIAGRLPELEQPLFMTSSNGQVLSMYARSSKIRRLFDQADVISADGQPMV
ncbi:MAG: glycosyltransferase, partial [Ferrovibrionaceae bacterium]